MLLHCSALQRDHLPDANVCTPTVLRVVSPVWKTLQVVHMNMIVTDSALELSNCAPGIFTF